MKGGSNTALWAMVGWRVYSISYGCRQISSLRVVLYCWFNGVPDIRVYRELQNVGHLQMNSAKQRSYWRKRGELSQINDRDTAGKVT